MHGRVAPAPACALALAASGLACAAPTPAPTPLRFAHTLGAAEAAGLDARLRGRTPPVESTLLPFARAVTILAELTASGDECPDLVRIDATWLPSLAEHLAPPPPTVARTPWLPAAAELATWHGALAAAPMSIDGLVIVQPATAPPIAEGDLVAAAVARGRGQLGLRVDGYWLVPFLRAHGADVADGERRQLGVDGAAAETALTEFAGLFAQGVAAPPAPPGAEAELEAARFRRGDTTVVVTGPWAFPTLATATAGELSGLAVSALPGAPRGAQLLAVPRCARSPDDAWALAAELTAPPVQIEWSRTLGTVPTTQAALDGASPLARGTYAALAAARPLPRHRLTTALFDDLTPAVAAVVAGDATAAEAMAGVRRAWRRALEREAP